MVQHLPPFNRALHATKTCSMLENPRLIWQAPCEVFTDHRQRKHGSKPLGHLLLQPTDIPFKETCMAYARNRRLHHITTHRTASISANQATNSVQFTLCHRHEKPFPRLTPTARPWTLGGGRLVGASTKDTKALVRTFIRRHCQGNLCQWLSENIQRTT